MNEQTIKMSLEDMPRFLSDDNPELAIARCLFLSTRPNSHKFTIPEDVLMRDAKTILGKFLVGNLNIFESDVTTHLKEPDIFGYIPMEQEIQFVRAADGYLDAYVNAVVSKIYATKVYDLFLDDNFRNVSVEMMIGYSDEETKIVSHFNVAGLTILGKQVNPSVPHAHMELTKFSAEEAEQYYKMANSSNFETEVLSKLNSICNKLNLNNVTINNEQSEENMAKLEEQEKDVVMEKPTDDEVQEAPKEEEAKLAEAPKSEEEKPEEETKEAESKCAEDEKCAEDDSDDDDKDDDKEDDEKEKLSCENAKLAEQVAEYEAKFSAMETELEELRKFKADTENEKTKNIVTQTLAQVKDKMDETTYAKFEEVSNECNIDTVNAWRNEVLANVATVLMSKKDNDESHLRMGVETPDNTPKGLWDRM